MSLKPYAVPSLALLADRIDQVLDCLALPFPDSSLRFIAMHNVFHHVCDVEKFLQEVARTLMPGGRSPGTNAPSAWSHAGLPLRCVVR